MMSQQAVIVSLLTDATKHLTRGSTQRQRRIQYDTTPSLYPACVSETAKDYSASIVLSRGSTEKKTIEITFFKSERSPWSPVFSTAWILASVGWLVVGIKVVLIATLRIFTADAYGRRLLTDINSVGLTVWAPAGSICSGCCRLPLIAYYTISSGNNSPCYTLLSCRSHLVAFSLKNVEKLS